MYGDTLNIRTNIGFRIGGRIEFRKKKGVGFYFGYSHSRSNLKGNFGSIQVRTIDESVYDSSLLYHSFIGTGRLNTISIGASYSFNLGQRLTLIPELGLLRQRFKTIPTSESGFYYRYSQWTDDMGLAQEIIYSKELNHVSYGGSRYAINVSALVEFPMGNGGYGLKPGVEISFMHKAVNSARVDLNTNAFLEISVWYPLIRFNKDKSD